MARTTAELPEFTRKSPLLEDAYRFAQAAHHGPANEGDTAIDHPEAVARLLHDAGFSEQVVAAALLHDVVEDTAIDLREISSGFGREIEALVADMTEDERIPSYEERKAEHRARISRDRRVAAIYAADKVANTRAMREGSDEPDPEKVDHYRKTLDTLSRTHPDLPFLGVLRDELELLCT